jgi:hypothetical protein
MNSEGKVSKEHTRIKPRLCISPHRSLCRTQLPSTDIGPLISKVSPGLSEWMCLDINPFSYTLIIKCNSPGELMSMGV